MVTPSATLAQPDVPSNEAPIDQPLKPSWRGWLHFVMAPTALVAGLVLLVLCDTWLARLGVAIYVLSAVVMFGNSAAYHRGDWTPARKQVFRRLDHAFIFTFIAGTYTPLCLTVLQGTSRILLLSLVWSCAILGLLFRVLWLSAPRALYVALYILMGWAAVFWMPELWRGGGPVLVLFLVAGGLIYTAGAVSYGMKRPNPWPRHFGFHEIFHLCTILAAACHFVTICLALLSAR